MAKYDKADLERRMKGAVESLKSDLSGLRTGRANTALLDPITVTVYGSQMPLNQVATVSAPEPRLLSVQVWDKNNIGPVEKAIRSAGLGLNPINDGNNIRLPIPDLTEERRKELAKLASNMPKPRASPSAMSGAMAWKCSKPMKTKRKFPRTSASVTKAKCRS